MSRWQYVGKVEPLQPIIQTGWLGDLVQPFLRKNRLTTALMSSGEEAPFIPIVPSSGRGSYLLLLGVQ